jgi:hypothetical protein
MVGYENERGVDGQALASSHAQHGVSKDEAGHCKML